MPVSQKYAIKELFYTLQGEGHHSGRPAVFCRFSGCNLWSGREQDRAKAICQFCDTDFWGTDGLNGGKFTAKALAEKAISLWPKLAPNAKPYIVCTGGEPLLQLDSPLITALHKVGFEIAVETNGTIPVPEGIDWICMSPKAYTEILVTKGNELKLVYPQLGAEPDKYVHLSFEHFYLQPMDSPTRLANTEAAVNYCLANPMWKISVQTHKILGIP